MVRDVTLDGGRVTVVIALTVPGCPLRASFQEQVEKRSCRSRAWTRSSSAST